MLVNLSVVLSDWCIFIQFVYIILSIMCVREKERERESILFQMAGPSNSVPDAQWFMYI